MNFNRRDTMFNKRQKEKFKDSVKKKIDIEKGIDIKTAFICGYLDVARTPLKGINKKLQKKCGKSSKDIRDSFIDECLSKSLSDLFNTSPKDAESFDGWHKSICEKIKKYYSKKGYDDFSLGKAQKWINMSLKYASLYCYDIEGNLNPIFKFFHVPIDRYVATPIVRELRVKLPKIEGFNMPSAEKYDTFDAENRNYSWSKIDDYDSYIECQKQIREKCKAKNIEPLAWEFEAWCSQKNNR